MIIGRQIKKLGIEDYAREKTPKYTEEQITRMTNYTDDKSKCSDDVRFIGKNKYPQKILMGLAISN